MIQLEIHEIEAVTGGGFFEDLGEAVGQWLGKHYSGNSAEWHADNAEAIRAADSSGLM